MDTQPPQYIASWQKEITKLLKKSIFKVIILKEILSNIQVLKSRFLDGIKNPSIDKAYKKSSLVVQAYNDKNKKFVLKK